MVFCKMAMEGTMLFCRMKIENAFGQCTKKCLAFVKFILGERNVWKVYFFVQTEPNK